MLTLAPLLEKAGVDPAVTVVFRHRPPQPKLRQFLPSYVTERPELFKAYQSAQAGQAAAMLKRARFLASFIGQETDRATFAGVWRVEGYRAAAPTDVETGSPLAQLRDLGVGVVVEGEAPDLLFELADMDCYSEWVGRLMIGWPTRGISWKLWANTKVFPVRAIHEESRFVDDMPHWTELSLSWQELAHLPSSWRARISQWRGVYYIFDEERGRGYVGSACGEDNILGRWRDYAATGHGGNVRLRASNPEKLRFSVLEQMALNAEPERVVKLEQTWMLRLQTRAHGLN